MRGHRILQISIEEWKAKKHAEGVEGVEASWVVTEALECAQAA
eukprot:CAMPEP_0184402942 /NCGR_PEP_ID=MMETSP0007-20130409/84943_1 /TAXON_ID=97485 /ORGANISM="Prymnesium parvum, Strain Texoma1" /LENGTH=42 /DNA_ID= /DNA_START= /DNA_END= /DNA_ORIENTATION=